MTGAGCSSFDEADNAVAELSRAAEQLICAKFCKLTGDQLLDLGRDLETAVRLVWAAQVHLVDELAQQGVAAARSVASTAALIRDAFGIAPGEAKLRVDAAAALLPQDLPTGGETPSQRPLLRDAVDAGNLDGDHVRTVLATLRRLPDVNCDTAELAEQTLVEYAVTNDAHDFKRIARHLEAVLDPDGTPADDSVRSKIEFTIGPRSIATGLTSINGFLDDLGIATIRAVLDPLAAPKAEADGIKDSRPAATRRAHALVEALGFVAAHGGDVLPDARGERPQVTVTLEWDVLRAAAGTATIDGHRLSPADTRRLMCDAQIIPAVLDGASEVLDLGRSQRTFNRATRRAISLRDRGCVWPGCDRPPSWCDAHHVRWWERDFGDTSYDNGVLLCAFHHTEIHRSDWRLHIATDGTPELTPPRWIDPKQAPRRNMLHHFNPIRRTRFSGDLSTHTRTPVN